jgi:hypothetical protein
MALLAPWRRFWQTKLVSMHISTACRDHFNTNGTHIKQSSSTMTTYLPVDSNVHQANKQQRPSTHLERDERDEHRGQRDGEQSGESDRVRAAIRTIEPTASIRRSCTDICQAIAIINTAE